MISRCMTLMLMEYAVLRVMDITKGVFMVGKLFLMVANLEVIQ